MRIAISLPEQDLRETDKLAKALRLSRSALIRLALLEYIRRQGSNEGQGGHGATSGR